jgi:hypothetical protein
VYFRYFVNDAQAFFFLEGVVGVCCCCDDTDGSGSGIAILDRFGVAIELVAADVVLVVVVAVGRLMPAWTDMMSGRGGGGGGGGGGIFLVGVDGAEAAGVLLLFMSSSSAICKRSATRFLFCSRLALGELLHRLMAATSGA